MKLKIFLILFIIFLSIFMANGNIDNVSIVYGHQRIPLYTNESVNYVLYLPIDTDMNINYNIKQIKNEMN